MSLQPFDDCCDFEDREDLRGGADECEEFEPEICPACGEQTLFPAGSEMYGTDRDGRRGVRVYYTICAECGYEGESQ